MTTGVTWPTFREGDTERNWRARDLNFLVEQVRKLSNISTGPGLAVEHTRSGVHLTVRPEGITTAVAATTGMQVRWASISDPANWDRLDSGDTFDASFVSISEANELVTEEAEFRVAKPYEIRRTPFHNKPQANGFTYQYDGTTDLQRTSITTTAPENTERQIVTPGYHEGVIVPVIQMGDLLLTSRDASVKWQELTVRRFAKEL